MARLLLSILLTTSLFCQKNVATFLETLYDDNKNDYQSKNKSEFIQFCENNNIDNSKVINQEHYYFISFLHDLLTSSSASDFVAGGILDIPYLWHWQDPNLRHSIIFLPDSVRLSEVPPPDEFSKYKSYADIDRISSLYLKDLFADKPKYYHDEFGEFYTFGWCSEREMAFNTLLSLPAFGYECKIKQEGIHVWSEVWIEFVNNDGVYNDIIARVDNTFDTISWESPINVHRQDMSENLRARERLISKLVPIWSPKDFNSLDDEELPDWQEPKHKILPNGDWVIILYDDIHNSNINLIYSVAIAKDSRGKYYESNYHYCGNGASAALDVFIEGPHAYGKRSYPIYDGWMGDYDLWKKNEEGKNKRLLLFREISISGSPLPFVEWIQDYGSGAQINWYNNQAEYQIQSVEEIIVSKNVSNRIYQLVSKALKK